jgi:putative transposase
LVEGVIEDFQVSQRRACRVLLTHRSLVDYQSIRKDPVVLRMRLRELAAARPRYGYRRLHVLLGREGWHVNIKRVYRLYKEEGLIVRTKRRKKLVSHRHLVMPDPVNVNQLWSMDFVRDTLSNGKAFRALTIIDTFSRESSAIKVGHSLTSKDVTLALDEILLRRTKPGVIRTDNGSEFTSDHFDAWAHYNGIKIDFIQPGRPSENGMIESFNGKLRDECLNTNWFQSLEEAVRLIEEWRRDYNETRPRSSLGNLAPAAYAAELLAELPIP